MHVGVREQACTSAWVHYSAHASTQSGVHTRTHAVRHAPQHALPYSAALPRYLAHACTKHTAHMNCTHTGSAHGAHTHSTRNTQSATHARVHAHTCTCLHAATQAHILYTDARTKDDDCDGESHIHQRVHHHRICAVLQRLLDRKYDAESSADPHLRVCACVRAAAAAATVVARAAVQGMRVMGVAWRAWHACMHANACVCIVRRTDTRMRKGMGTLK